jgi:arylsulfatase A-like enzyme
MQPKRHRNDLHRSAACLIPPLLRRGSCFALPLFLSAVLLVACGGSDDDGAELLVRPNIVWIVADDMNFEIGAFGDPVAQTPRIDALAAAGVRYTNVFATSGVCAPSRAALITGMYATSIGAHHMRSLEGGYQPVPPPDVKTFTEHLRAAGYYTSNLGKTDYQFSGPLREAPLTNWNQPSGDWRGRAPGQPFFSYFTLLITHESFLFGNREPATNPAAVTVPPYYPDTPAVRRDFARLYDNVAAMDDAVGRILDMLEEDGVADDTIVFFFPDNGRGFPRDKRWVYDGGIHEPLIVRWPDGRGAGSIDDRLISFVDLPATVLSLAGVPLPSYVQGRPFLGAQAERESVYIFAAADRHDEAPDRIRAVRDKRYKYLRNFQPETPYGQSIAFRNNLATMQEIFRLHDEGQLTPPTDWYYRQTKPLEELYDIVADPYELNNLAGRPELADVLERMRAAQERWAAETGDLGDIPEADLAELYWPGGVQPTTQPPSIDPPGGEFPSPVEVSISCPTEGASIAFTLDTSDAPYWQLYTAPVVVAGDATLRARAVRYGYRESSESTVTIRAGK